MVFETATAALLFTAQRLCLIVSGDTGLT